MSFLHTAENLIYGATDVVEIAEMLGGHPISPLGTVVHGVSALGHLGAGLLADDEKAAHHQYAEAALNGVEAIPLLGTGISIANLASQYLGQPDSGEKMDGLPELVEDWMFGDRNLLDDMSSALPWNQKPVDTSPISVPIDPAKIYDPEKAADAAADRSWAAWEAREAADEKAYLEEFDYGVYKELHTPAAVPQAAPARDYTWAEQVENHKKWVASAGR